MQAAPTGFTAIVDSDGNVVERTAVSEQRVIDGDVELRTGFTWYTSLGDAPFIIAVLLVLLALDLVLVRPATWAAIAPTTSGGVRRRSIA